MNRGKKPIMPWNPNRKRRLSDLQDSYAGPEEFMEPGVRGFLMTTLPDREEFAVDQAIQMLRKASIYLYGGTKEPAKGNPAERNGYVLIDFMDPQGVTIHPGKDDEAGDAEEQQKSEESTDLKTNEEKNETQDSEKTESKETETTDVAENQDTEMTDAAEVEQIEKVDEEKPAKKDAEEMETDEKCEENMQSDEKSDQAEEAHKEESEEAHPKEISESGKETAKSEDTDKVKEDSNQPKTEEKDDNLGKTAGKKDEGKDKKSECDDRNKSDRLFMKASYNFKAFRTEIKNIMFVKSNVPDPKLLVNTVLELIANRKPLKADSLNQLLPVQGICNYDYRELEIMSRRVLPPFFHEDLESEPPSFSVLLFDKMSEPGADMLIEVVRSAIWSLNPTAWQASPLTEPDVVIRLELIGSKVAICAMSQFMKYRQYSPFYVSVLGPGEPEDEDAESQSSEKKRKIEEEKNTEKRSRTSQSQSEQMKVENTAEKVQQDSTSNEEGPAKKVKVDDVDQELVGTETEMKTEETKTGEDKTEGDKSEAKENPAENEEEEEETTPKKTTRSKRASRRSSKKSE